MQPVIKESGSLSLGLLNWDANSLSVHCSPGSLLEGRRGHHDSVAGSAVTQESHDLLTMSARSIALKWPL